jgi:hypothetical protein
VTTILEYLGRYRTNFGTDRLLPSLADNDALAYDNLTT